jgi:hypothetical protein
MKKGDRVIVTIPSGIRRNEPVRYAATIVGESRDNVAWTLIKDGTKFPRGIHKSFCTPETPGEAPE